MKANVKKIKLLLTILFIVSFLSCNDTSSNVNRNKSFLLNRYKPGFVLTFDDAYIHEWFAIKNILIKYNVKATFFVSGFNKLSTEEISELQILEKEGNEIGSHSLKHFNAVNFIQNRNLKTYLDTDILSELKLMKKKGFRVTTFSYPYGSNN